MLYKILIVYASFGQGHRVAATSLVEFLNASSKDLLDFSSTFIKKIYSLSYIVVTQYFPSVWKFLFLFTRRRFITLLLEKIHILIFSSFLKYLVETKPKIIIATHFFPLSLIATVKEKLNLKLISIVTDLRVHPLWVESKVDFYFVALEETKRDLISLGIKENKIIAGFIPLKGGFQKKLSKENLREKFSFDSKPCLVFIFSLRNKFSFVKDLLPQLLNDFNIFVIYGRDKRIKQYLKRQNTPSLKVFAFYEKIWELFSLSSIIITKPGGLTVFEGIYLKKPFIFTHYIPGQEKENMDLLTNYGVAKFVQSRQALMKAITYFAGRIEELRSNYPLEVKDVRFILRDVIKAISNG